MTMACLTIPTPHGEVAVGDEVLIDLSGDPVARNYGWPKRRWGRAIGTHADYLSIDFDVPVPKHLQTPCPPLGFLYNLSAANADQVLAVRKVDS